MISPTTYFIYIAILALIICRQYVRLDRKERVQRRWERKIEARKKLWNR